MSNCKSEINSREAKERVAAAKHEIVDSLKKKSIDNELFNNILKKHKINDEQTEEIESWAQKSKINIVVSEKEFLKMKEDDYLNTIWENRPRNKAIIDGFSKYLKDISRYPLLTPEEEKDLGRRVRDNNDKEAFDKLMMSNLRLVVALAKNIKFRGNLTFPDIVQEGNVGLAEAIPNYDPDRKTSFASYARWHIHHVMYRAVENKGRLIRVPVSAQADMTKINRFKREYVAKNGYEPSDADIISNVPGITKKKLKNYRPHFTKPSSIDVPTGDNDNSNVCDFIADKRKAGVVERVNAEFLKKDISMVLKKDLNDIEREVVLKRLGFYGSPVSSKDLAFELGKDKREINLIYKQALIKLRNGNNMDILKNYYLDM